MKIEFIETVLVCLIVSIQITVFARTFFKIRLFKRIIPNIDSLYVTKVIVPVSDLERLSPKEFLSKIQNYKKDIRTSPGLGCDIRRCRQQTGAESPYDGVR